MARPLPTRRHHRGPSPKISMERWPMVSEAMTPMRSCSSRHACLLALALAGAVGAAGCAGQTRLAPEVRSAVEAQYQGKIVELRQSCYYGDLYEDNRRWLLTPHPSQQVHHIVDLAGNPIHPPDQRGIVPAGTRFSVRAIEFPTPLTMAGRMLTSPRYNPWVVLEPRDSHLLRREERRLWVLLLPRDMTTQQEVETHLAQLLAPKGTMEAWLEQRRPTVRVAIEHKDLVAGMNAEEMLAARGEPLARLQDEHRSKQIEVAWYGDREAWLLGSRVIRVLPARPLEQHAAP